MQRIEEARELIKQNINEENATEAEKKLGEYLLAVIEDDTNGLARNWAEKGWTTDRLMDAIADEVRKRHRNGNSCCMTDEEVYRIAHDVIIDGNPDKTAKAKTYKVEAPTAEKPKEEPKPIIKKEPKKESKKARNDGWNNDLFAFLEGIDDEEVHQ